MVLSTAKLEGVSCDMTLDAGDPFRNKFRPHSIFFSLFYTKENLANAMIDLLVTYAHMLRGYGSYRSENV